MVPGFVSMINDLAQITHLKRFSVTNKFDCRDSNNIEVTLNANGATLRTVSWNLVSSPVNRSAACVIAISAAILRRTLLESGDVKDISMMWDELAVGYTRFFGIVVIGGMSVPQQRIYSVRSVVRQVDDTARRLLKFTVSLEHSLRARAERKQAEESRVPIPSPGRDTYLEVLAASLEKVRSETHVGLVYAPLVAIAGDDEIAVLSCDQQPAQFHRQLCAVETR